MIKISSELIQKVLLTYKTELLDQVSIESNFFNFLSNVNVSDSEIFGRAFIALDDGLFVPSDFYNYVDRLQIKADVSSLLLFLNNLSTPLDKLSNLREKLLTRSYLSYGNMNAYLTNIFQDPDNTLFLRNVADADSLDFLLTPIIKYGASVQSSAYSSYIKVEDAYWNIVSGWLLDVENTLPTPTIDILNRIVQYTFDKSYNNLIYGVPVLLKNSVEKPRYIRDKEIDDTVISIFKGTYKALSVSEVYGFIDKMLAEYIVYDDDYDYNLTEAPDLREYAENRIEELNELPLSSLTINIFKEMIFYAEFVANFFNITNTLDTKISGVNIQIVNVYNALNSLRTRLLNNGFFK
jgi:hypothetical protein